MKKKHKKTGEEYRQETTEGVKWREKRARKGMKCCEAQDRHSLTGREERGNTWRAKTDGQSGEGQRASNVSPIPYFYLTQVAIISVDCCNSFLTSSWPLLLYTFSFIRNQK